MFDIKEYFNESTREHNNSSSIYVETGSVEDDISIDIDNLLRDRFDSLYFKDKFKFKSSGIEIIYPRIVYPGRRAIIKSSDYVRFLLSQYPLKSDFDNIDKIVLRPRHIEIGDIELMALYLRKKKILVMYLYTQHFYKMEGSKFKDYSELSSCQLSDLVQTSIKKDTDNPDAKSKCTALKVPPLWYILSMVSSSDDNNIDKFFIKRNKEYSKETARILEEISFYYSRYGY